MKWYTDGEVNKLASLVAQNIMQGKKSLEISKSIAEMSILPDYIERMSIYLHNYCLGYFESYFIYPTQRGFFIKNLAAQLSLKTMDQQRIVEVTDAKNVNIELPEVTNFVTKRNAEEDQVIRTDEIAISDHNISVPGSKILVATHNFSHITVIQQDNRGIDESTFKSILEQSGEQKKLLGKINDIVSFFDAPDAYLTDSHLLEEETRINVVSFIRSFLWKMLEALPLAEYEQAQANRKSVLPTPSPIIPNHPPLCGYLSRACLFISTLFAFNYREERNTNTIQQKNTSNDQSQADVLPPGTTPKKLSIFINKIKSCEIM